MAEPRARRAAKTRPSAGSGVRAREVPSLWHRPALLNLVADLLMLFAAVGLGWALVAWFLSRPLFPLREVVVLTPPAQVTTAQLEYVARTAIRGTFFTVDLETVRSAFEKLPWVRRAQVRRRWPDALELRLEEHQAVAYWTLSETGDTRLVNRQGEVFTASSNASMPSFSGPQGSAPYLLARHTEYVRLLEPLGRRPVALSVSAREAWRLRLDDGLVITLGRDQDKAPLAQRLARFVAAWPQARENIGIQVAAVDLRYPSGFAVMPAPAAQAGKGK